MVNPKKKLILSQKLCRAVCQNNIDLARALLKQGADPQCLTCKGTAISLAMQNGTIENFSAMFLACPSNESIGNDILRAAFGEHDVEVLCCLIENNARTKELFPGIILGSDDFLYILTNYLSDRIIEIMTRTVPKKFLRRIIADNQRKIVHHMLYADLSDNSILTLIEYGLSMSVICEMFVHNNGAKHVIQLVFDKSNGSVFYPELLSYVFKVDGFGLEMKQTLMKHYVHAVKKAVDCGLDVYEYAISPKIFPSDTELKFYDSYLIFDFLFSRSIANAGSVMYLSIFGDLHSADGCSYHEITMAYLTPDSDGNVAYTIPDGKTIKCKTDPSNNYYREGLRRDFYHTFWESKSTTRDWLDYIISEYNSFLRGEWNFEAMTECACTHPCLDVGEAKPKRSKRLFSWLKTCLMYDGPRCDDFHKYLAVTRFFSLIALTGICIEGPNPEIFFNSLQITPRNYHQILPRNLRLAIHTFVMCRSVETSSCSMIPNEIVFLIMEELR